MNLLPSMLVAATLIGGAGSTQSDITTVNAAGIQNQSEADCIPGQVIVGTPSNIESILGNLGVDLESLKDCIRPSVPGTDSPESEIPDTDTPDIEKPDTEKPDIEKPDSDKPNSDKPSDKPNSDKPGGGNPDADIPGDIPDTDNPGSNPPGSGSEENTEAGYAEQVTALVNMERAKVNLPALTMTDDLNRAALIRAKETAQSFSHTRPDGSNFSSVLTENGISYRGSGENIAWGQASPEAVVNAWMSSDGHRANILNKDFTSIGIGLYWNNTTPYWAQLFTY